MKLKPKQIEITNGKLLIGGSSTSTETGYTIPASVGTSGHVLTSDGTNVVFQAASGGGGGGSRPTVDTSTINSDANGTISNPNSSVLEIVYLVSGTTSTVTLPTAVNNEGLKIQIKNMLTSAVTINPPTNQTIDNGSSVSLTSQYESLTFISTDSNWVII